MELEKALAKIRGKRCELKYSQQDIADKLNISLKTYCFKENGTSEFTFAEIIKLCKIFECKIDDFF